MRRIREGGEEEGVGQSPTIFSLGVYEEDRKKREERGKGVVRCMSPPPGCRPMAGSPQSPGVSGRCPNSRGVRRDRLQDV